MEFYLDQGYALFAQNRKIAGVEVDLIFTKPKLLFVEVKSLRCLDEIHFRITRGQIDRLLFARKFWQDRTEKDVELRFLFVGATQLLELGPEDLINNEESLRETSSRGKLR